MKTSSRQERLWMACRSDPKMSDLGFTRVAAGVSRDTQIILEARFRLG